MEPINISLSSIWNIVVAFVAAMGGGAAIVAAIVKFTSAKIADRLQAKYQLKLDKDFADYKSEIDKLLETHRTELGTKQHISVKRFDAEFEIYQNLTGYYFNAVRDCGVMIPVFGKTPAGREERLELDKIHFEHASKSVVEAQDYLHSIIPFIPEEFFQGYRELLDLFALQLDAYEKRFNVGYLAPREKKEKFDREDYNRTSEINEKFQNLCRQVREYLNSLDVIG